MITSLLIANRGEIACRVIRTARRLGIRTVAVYSDADAGALHVRMADEAVHIGPSPARESYLIGERIIAAAKETGAEAIHPGYGFLSENADFAQAVLDAGLIWVGPKPASIRAMGLKDAAKKLMADAGVPVTPGYLGEDQSPVRLQAEADEIGYPVLIKAVAGGGGKGMRKVDAAADFADALDSCKREAASSFGDDRVLIEKYILSPRHIEVQVFGDAHGNVVHLFERDCSLQRRHQKVIEEAPAPGMDEATRAAVCDAAVRAAQAVNYEGAGTIEFIADASEGLRADRIWFMEMNTRLQVEHPVTEAITGQDLVEWQLRVASGEPLPRRQNELSINGHAIEARLYAEDPARDFLPSVGKLELFRMDDWQGSLGVRIDSGVEEGDAISPYYDPMIAKVIAHDCLPDGQSRNGAIGKLSAALTSALRVWPVRTNAAFCNALITHPDFRSGRLDTSFISGRQETLLAPPRPSEAMLSSTLSRLMSGEVHPALAYAPPPPTEGTSDMGAFRLNAPHRRDATAYVDGEARTISLQHGSGTVNASIDHVPGGVVLTEGGQSMLVSLRASARAGGAAGDGNLVAPMPGKVTSVEVAAGERVTKGQRLLTLEAMKMEHAMLAPFDGMMAELNVTAGQQVPVEALLARVEADG